MTESNGPSWDNSYQDIDIPGPDKVKHMDFGEVVFEAAGEEPCRVLELGAGSGKFGFALAAAGHSVTVADNNPDVLEGLRNRRDHLGLDVEVANLDLLDVDIPDEEYDLVFNEGVIEHFLGSDRQHAFDEMARVSRDRVLVFVPHSQSLWYIIVDLKLRSFIPEAEYPFTRKELDQMMENAGIQIMDRGTAGRGNRQIWSLGTVE